MSRLASFTANPNLGHWTAAKHVLRYLAGTRDLGIVYSANNNPERPTKNFYFYSDADFANNLDCLSISGYTFLLSNGAIMWSSKKQNAVMLSTAEAEYTAMAHATKEAIWLRNLFTELGFHQTEPTIIFGDNQSAIAIAKNNQYHQWSKYFNLRNHFIRDKIKLSSIDICYCPTASMTADIFTKALPKPKHSRHTTELGLSSA